MEDLKEILRQENRDDLFLLIEEFIEWCREKSWPIDGDSFVVWIDC